MVRHLIIKDRKRKSEMKYYVNINGLDIRADFSKDTINLTFIPLLKTLAEIHSKKKKRVTAMLAAPPGAGKSTLASFLEHIARDVIPGKKFQAIGMDGFHRRQEYLLSHNVNIDGKEVSMVDIKGAPVTFDLDRFKGKLKELKEEPVCKWPLYDRLLHNPVEDKITVDGDIILLEGNYLLLNTDGWNALSSFADYTIFLTAAENILRERLIARRIAVGHSKEGSAAFVDFSDMANVRLCLERSKKADLMLSINENGEIVQE